MANAGAPCGAAAAASDFLARAAGAGASDAPCPLASGPPELFVPPAFLACAEAFKGAPHSSQYCEPSIFSVLHLSQMVIGISPRAIRCVGDERRTPPLWPRAAAARARNSYIVARNENARQITLRKQESVVSSQ